MRITADTLLLAFAIILILLVNMEWFKVGSEPPRVIVLRS